MKIKINNIFKNKQKSKFSFIKKEEYENEFNKLNTKVEGQNSCIYKKENFEEKKINNKPIFKVYKSGGQIVKYDLNILEKNTKNDEKKYIRSGAKVVNNNIEENFEKVERKKRQRSKKRFPKNSFLLFIFMILLAGTSLMFAYKNYELLNEESYAVYSSIDSKNEELEKNEDKEEGEEQNLNSNNNDTKQKEENTTIKNVTANTKKSVTSSNNTQNKQTTKVVPLNFAKPISGEIIKIYSKDKVIYSKTLELWKTHDGIDIKSDENAIVKSIEKGTVEKIYDDSFYGKTIVIDHGQGYKSSYSNLGDEIFVKEKQVIQKLAKIGRVGKSAIGEIKDETHLHFMLIKNNEISDPTSIFR